MGQDKNQECKLDFQSDETRLLTLSYLKYLAVATAYFLITGRDYQIYTIVCAFIDLPLPVMLQLHNCQVSFLWDKATLHHVNTTLMMVLNSTFDMAPFMDLVDTLYVMHALQTIYGLMFNRAQVNKVPIMNYCSLLGYRSLQLEQISSAS
jgi:hypothetical protein